MPPSSPRAVVGSRDPDILEGQPRSLEMSLDLAGLLSFSG